ncbi:hypothetical protein GCM10020331_081510 [Ectobacillus funiculus]
MQINENDNTILALRDLKKDEELSIDGKTIQLKQDIYRGHKIALKEIQEKKNMLSNTGIQSAMHSQQLRLENLFIPITRKRIYPERRIIGTHRNKRTFHIKKMKIGPLKAM